MLQFKTAIVLENGNFANEKNYKCIYAKSRTECTNVHGVPYIDNNRPYYSKWIIEKEPEGFIFREVAHGSGISGHHKTVRSCVISACRGLFGTSDIDVFFTPGEEHFLINPIFDYTKFNTGKFRKEECYYGRVQNLIML